MTARGTWKAYELRVSKDLGGKRIPVTGLDRHGADVITPMFHCQIKLRNSLPAWLFTWLEGIVGTAAQQNKVGILILRKPRQEDNDALVIVRYRDWVELHGAPDAK